MTPSELQAAATAVLRDAAALVRRAWCQGANARDAAGYSVGPSEVLAARWCAQGAIQRAASDLLPEFAPLYASVPIAFQRLHHVVRMPISAWNDHRERTAEEVVAALLFAAGVK